MVEEGRGGRARKRTVRREGATARTERKVSERLTMDLFDSGCTSRVLREGKVARMMARRSSGATK